MPSEAMNVHIATIEVEEFSPQLFWEWNETVANTQQRVLPSTAKGEPTPMHRLYHGSFGLLGQSSSEVDVRHLKMECHDNGGGQVNFLPTFCLPNHRNTS